MRWKRALSILWLSVPFLTLKAQTADTPMSSEPHHHLAFQNQYLNVYEIEVKPGDSVLLHRHDSDVLAITIGDSNVTVGVPGKPDAPQKLTDGQLRLQHKGYVHFTHVNGPGVYRSIAVELPAVQTDGHNRCAIVNAGETLDCPSAGTLRNREKDYLLEPQYESDQTSVTLLRVRPHHSAPLPSRSELLVALNDVTFTTEVENAKSNSMHSGSWYWIDFDLSDHVVHHVRNDSGQEARILIFVPKVVGTAKVKQRP